jgi:hypothetical protein
VIRVVFLTETEKARYVIEAYEYETIRSCLETISRLNAPALGMDDLFLRVHRAPPPQEQGPPSAATGDPKDPHPPGPSPADETLGSAEFDRKLVSLDLQPGDLIYLDSSPPPSAQKPGVLSRFPSKPV